MAGRLRWKRPTPVQCATIPLALGAKDVLVRAPTGSGKTAAYALPLVNKMLGAPTGAEGGVRGLVLVPTGELVAQATKVPRCPPPP